MIEEKDYVELKEILKMLSDIIGRQERERIEREEWKKNSKW